MAQTPRPDVPLSQEGGIYVMSCMPTEPMGHVVEACFLRVDVEPDLDLGCVPASPGTTATKHLEIPITIDQDAEIRCFMVGSNNMNSEISENAGIVNFTRPGRPFVQSSP
jgi:hypothetical protein